MKNLLSSITSLSSKGQIVLPKKIRNELSLKTGTKLMVFSDGDNILLKPIYEPNKKEFLCLMEEAEEWAKEVRLKETDIDEAITVVRSNKNR